MEGPRGRRIALVVIVAACAAGTGILVLRGGGPGADMPDRTPAPVPEAETGEVRTSVRVNLSECNRDPSGRIYMKGAIRNSGTRNLQYVTVRSIWKNRAGLEVGGETFYALSGTVLKPGERKSFRHSTDLASAARCNAEPVDWW